MVAGMVYPPDTQYGPNASLGVWIPVVVIGVSVLVVVFNHRPGTSSESLQRSLIPYAAVLLFGAVSLAWSPDASEGSVLLLKLSVLIPVSAAAWQMRVDRNQRVWMHEMAAGAIGVLWVLFLVAWTSRLLDLGDLSRLMGIVTLGLPPLFVFATYAKYSTARTLVIGGAALVLALASDARMVAFVLAALIVSSPSLDVRTSVRAAAAIVGLLVFLTFSVVEAPGGQLFFFDEGGSVSNLVDGDDGILGGRGEVWSELWASCDDRLVVGNGLGASNVRGLKIDPSFPEPHNEYVRTFCDLGLPAASVFWAFFVTMGLHASRRVLRSLQPSASGVATLQMLFALGLLAVTDIPLTATAQFLAPLALVLGWSERRHQDSASL